MGLSVVEKRVDMVDDDEQEESARIAYARAVGARLRAMRKQMHLSLQAVESTSEQEFKASVLGAYERGERAISVPRLQRLARFYAVPVDQLLPREEGDTSSADVLDLTETGQRDARTAVTIDLGRLRDLDSAASQMLVRYLQMIQVPRPDFNGRVL